MTRQNPLEACYLLFSSFGNEPSSCKTASQFWNSSRCLVDAHNISSYNFFFGNLLDHFLPEIVNSLHVCCFDRELADFLSASSRGTFHFDLDNFSFQNLRFFFNSDSDRLSECLNTRFWEKQQRFKPASKLLSCSCRARISRKRPSPWKACLFRVIGPYPSRWRSYRFRADRRSEQRGQQYAPSTKHVKL